MSRGRRHAGPLRGLIDGLRDFFSQREGFLRERHTIDEMLEQRRVDGEIEWADFLAALSDLAGGRPMV